MASVFSHFLRFRYQESSYFSLVNFTAEKRTVWKLLMKIKLTVRYLFETKISWVMMHLLNK